MKFHQVETGLMKYIQEEIAAKAPSHLKFIIYAGTFLGTVKFEDMFEQYKDHPLIKALGVIHEDGDIDVDTLYVAMKKAIDKMGTFDYMGITFDEEDVNSLYNHIKRS